MGGPQRRRLKPPTCPSSPSSPSPGASPATGKVFFRSCSPGHCLSPCVRCHCPCTLTLQILYSAPSSGKPSLTDSVPEPLCASLSLQAAGLSQHTHLVTEP